MSINEIIVAFMMVFMLIAAFDRVLDQFGGAEEVLGKIGLKPVAKLFAGAGAQFEEGFMAMGALGLAMVGMTALAPVLAHVLGPVIIPLYEMLGANPSMFAGTLLACDMGGFFLAKELAGALFRFDPTDGANGISHEIGFGVCLDLDERCYSKGTGCYHLRKSTQTA